MRFDTWAEFLEHQRRQPYMRQISDFVKAERHIAAGPRRVTDPPMDIYPAAEDVFRFTETPLRDVKVVILGQDPYHGPGQADGLAFSVRDPSVCPRCLNHANMQHYCEKAGRDVEVYAQPLPPSLQNILRELADDVSVKKHANGTAKSVPYFGNLTPWTRQGVLLLNTALTVRRGEAGSHCDIWQPFTDEVIRAVCDSVRCVHFILWGSKAKAAFERNVGKLHTFALSDHPERDQLVAHNIQRAGLMSKRITATYSAHPSPLSANKGFFGSRPFSRANTALLLNNPGCAPVDWRLS